MKSLSEEFQAFLLQSGAGLAGFGNIRAVVPESLKEYTLGVSIVLPLPAKLLQEIEEGPTKSYLDTYHSLNAELDRIALAGEEWLKARGYQALAQTGARVLEYGNYRTSLPHKTVATRAGLGWIGKSCLLVTPEYGPSVRISSLLTDAPLAVAQPINESRCGECMVCHDHCPGKAISGKCWSVSTERDSFFNPLACRRAARAWAKERLGEEITLCGQCFVWCPYTRRRMINKEENTEALSSSYVIPKDQ